MTDGTAWRSLNAAFDEDGFSLVKRDIETLFLKTNGYAQDLGSSPSFSYKVEAPPVSPLDVSVGVPGADGANATVAIGSTTTGAPGSPASVTNSGTTQNAVFNFTIPAGADGATGATGATGPAGPGFTDGTVANQLKTWDGSAWVNTLEPLLGVGPGAAGATAGRLRVVMNTSGDYVDITATTAVFYRVVSGTARKVIDLDLTAITWAAGNWDANCLKPRELDECDTVGAAKKRIYLCSGQY